MVEDNRSGNVWMALSRGKRQALKRLQTFEDDLRCFVSCTSCGNPRPAREGRTPHRGGTLGPSNFWGVVQSPVRVVLCELCGNSFATFAVKGCENVDRQTREENERQHCQFCLPRPSRKPHLKPDPGPRFGPVPDWTPRRRTVSADRRRV